MSPTVIVFLKAPRPGFVKTRLARDLGGPAAVEIYRDLAEQQLRRIPAVWRVEVHFTPADAEREMHAWLGNGRVFRAQAEGDLGARLSAGFREAFRAGGSPVIAIGGDCPGLDGDCLEAARIALREADVVLGPATDGGYYLVGLNRPSPELFREIPWSSPQVLAATLARAEAAGLRCRLLAPKSDIDDAGSWERYQAVRSNARKPAEAIGAPAGEDAAASLPQGYGCADDARRRHRPASAEQWPVSLTVIIPALNEAAGIQRAVQTAMSALPGARVVVVDGGSSDGTAALAGSAGADVLVSARGRGVQLEAGAQLATTEWLLFLHADTLLPGTAAQIIGDFVRIPQARIATFRLRFDSAGWFLRACCWFTRFDTVFTRFGDQGILIRHDLYRTVGGFPAWPLFEDVALLQRARRLTRVWSLGAAVTTSARRFDHRGHISQQWLNARLLLRFLAGADPQRLAEIYRASALRRRDAQRAAFPSLEKAE